jgi:hypothetical protein
LAKPLFIGKKIQILAKPLSFGKNFLNLTNLYYWQNLSKLLNLYLLAKPLPLGKTFLLHG